MVPMLGLWGLQSYVKEARCNVKKQLLLYNLRFNKKLLDVKYSPRIPFSSVDYKSELDASLMCDRDKTNYFQNLIWVLRWIIALGRIDIAYEVSNFLTKPQTGHIYQDLHIFKYLETHIKNDLSFNPLYHHHVHSKDISNIINNMKKVYVDAVEDLPSNALES